MMEPATLEHLATLRAKSGSDVDKEIYAFKDKGGRDVGLRFDLTVGMARYVCSRRDLRPPIKLASVAGAWRYDEPQHARYRWFRQWDLEIFGPVSVGADAEVIETTYRLYQKLGVKFSVQVGDRGAVQKFVNDGLGITDQEKAVDLMRALDKAKKKTLGELKREYGTKGYKEKAIESLFEFGRISGSQDHVLDALSERGLESPALVELRDELRGRGLTDVKYNMGVVRGIDYYTGIVFEVMDSEHPDLGSLAGGGRYDLLPRTFGRPDLSATGAAGGIERTAMAISGKANPQPLLVYVAAAGPSSLQAARRTLTDLRESGISAETSLQEKPLSKQLEDASRMGATWAVIVGEKEAKEKAVTLREMSTRVERSLPLSLAIDSILAGSQVGRR